MKSGLTDSARIVSPFNQGLSALIGEFVILRIRIRSTGARERMEDI